MDSGIMPMIKPVTVVYVCVDAEIVSAILRVSTNAETFEK